MRAIRQRYFSARKQDGPFIGVRLFLYRVLLNLIGGFMVLRSSVVGAWMRVSRVDHDIALLEEAIARESGRRQETRYRGQDQPLPSDEPAASPPEEAQPSSAPSGDDPERKSDEKS